MQMGQSEQLFKGLPDCSGSHQRDLSWEFLLQLPTNSPHSSAHRPSVTSVTNLLNLVSLDCDKKPHHGERLRFLQTVQRYSTGIKRAQTQSEPCLCNKLCLARSEPAPASLSPNLLQLIKYQELFGVWQHMRICSRSLLLPGE